MVTTGELSRAGGKAVVGTDPPTLYSAESTSSQSLAAALSTLAMSQARSILPTILHEASTPQLGTTMDGHHPDDHPWI